MQIAPRACSERGAAHFQLVFTSFPHKNPGLKNNLGSLAGQSAKFVSRYAGATVEVLEGLDGQLKVRHEERIIAAQEAPPSPVSLRNGHQPPAVSPVAPIGVNHWDERWTAHLAPLVSSQEPAADQPDCTDGEVAAAPPATVAPRKPTFLQRERWTEGEMEGARACRCGQSNGSWASTGPPSGVIWRPEVRQDGSSGWCPIRRHRIPWQRNGVTFSLNTYPDIFPDLRHRLHLAVGPLAGRLIPTNLLRL